MLLLIPGPTVLLAISYALCHGRRVALATVAGVSAAEAASSAPTPNGWLAASARRLIRPPAVQRTINRAGGALLIGAGALTAAPRLKSPARMADGPRRAVRRFASAMGYAARDSGSRASAQ